MTRFTAWLFVFMFMPIIAFAQVTAVTPLEDDPFKLVEQIVAAAGAKNWLLLVPLAMILVIYLVRKFVGPRVPFLQTDRGGALLALIGAVLAAVLAAVSTPGAHTFVSVTMAAFAVLMTNKLLFVWINKLMQPTGADKAEELQAKVAALEAKLDVSPSVVVAGATNEAVAELKGLTGTNIK